MRKVIGIGETVLDIIFKDERPVEAVPGGSTFNSIISLGRCGVPVTFVSEVGDDRVGRKVLRFLSDNGVDTSCVNVCQGVKSPISLAFLDEHNNAEYAFYRDAPHDSPEVTCPDIEADDIVVFGSFYAVNPARRAQVSALLEEARNRGAIIYYDINFRPAHRQDIMRITPNLLDNLEYADIVRASREDCATLYRSDEADRVYKAEISFYSRRFVYTDGAQPTVVFDEGGLRREYPVPPVQTVSTVGAGDNFNAGLVYALVKYGIRRADIVQGLAAEQWDKIVDTAQQFSADCCRDIFNYVSVAFGESRKKEE